MVGAVRVEVFVAHSIACADHERRPDLRNTLARLVDVVAPFGCLARGFPGARVQEPEPVEGPHRRGARGGRVVVDQNEIRDLFLAHERLCIAPITRADRDDLGSERSDFVVTVTQLRGMFAAMQSTEMAEEHQNGWLVAPQVTQPMCHAGAVDKRNVGEGGQVHDRGGYSGDTFVEKCPPRFTGG